MTGAPAITVGTPKTAAQSDVQRVTRTHTLTWSPGHGPRVDVITRNRGAAVFHDAAVISAILTYTWWPENGRWSRDGELKAVIPVKTTVSRDGWSHYPTHVYAGNSRNHRDVEDALDAIYMPRTHITITEEGPDT